MNKPILCLDFDGVLHAYTSGWKGADIIPDSAVPGAAEFLKEAVEHFMVHIFSSRSNQDGGIVAMHEWCCLEFGGEFTREHLHFPTEKPPAFISLDDRCILFEGEWPIPEALLAFKPWNKR